MRFSDFCEKFLTAHDLYYASVPWSAETLRLALKEAGFTVIQAEQLMSSLTLWVDFSLGEKDLGLLLEVHYISIVPLWIRMAYSVENWHNRLSDPEYPLPTLRSYD